MMAKFTYASAFNLSEDPFSSAVGSSSSSSFGASDDDLDDACSICLEPFTIQDPATVTSCRHEYHLQCILEWSQRSKECPICWQLFVLKDTSSQELLAAVEKERLLRLRNISSAPARPNHHSLGDFDGEEDASHSDGFDERLMLCLADVAHRGCLLRRRDRQRPSRLGSSNAPIIISPTDIANHDQEIAISQEGHQNPSSCLSDGTMTSAIPSPANLQTPSSIPGVSPGAADGNKFRFLPGSFPSHSSQNPNPSETFSLPETIKSKLSAASARYKESISKSKQGLKEKLLARNNSMKELSKGVQREMNAGIAGVARMIERLDLASKRFGVSAPVSASSNSTRFNFPFKGKGVEENAGAETLNKSNGDRTAIPHLQGEQSH